MNIQNLSDFPLRTLALPPLSGAEPKNIVLLLHGLGSNAEDLISLAPLMARDLPDTLFLSVDAPYPCDMAPFGYQWFSLQDRDPARILKELRQVRPVLEDYIAEVIKKYQIKNNELALSGFSQGTMTSLFTSLYAKEAFAGILGYSGAFFPDTEAGALTKQPVCLIHGTADDVVPFDNMKTAENLLQAQDFDIETLACPGLGHSIDENGIAKGTAFLKRILYTAA
ncbi:MAG: phospholipase [Micavibrio sp.]|nr:MAG: phospholipase [Micavibrio sp.]